MLKINKTALFVLAALSSSQTFSYEISENFKIGAYGDATFVNYDGTSDQVLKSNTNAYMDLEFKETFQLMLDVNYQTNDYQGGDDTESDFSEGDLYQAFVGFNTQSLGVKAGRFADFYVKGENALKIGNTMTDTSFAPLTVLGQARYSTIDGISVTYRSPLNDGVFSGSVYGGSNTQKYAYEQELGKELTGEGMKYGAHFDISKGYHTYIVGIHLAELDKVDLLNKVVDENKTNDYFNFYSAYQYENDLMFSDNAFMYGKFDEGDEDIEQTIVDMKLGAKFIGFKPFVGLNYFKNMAEKYQTISYGVKYEYKGVGAIVKRENIKKKEGLTDIDDHRLTASIFYNF